MKRCSICKADISHFKVGDTCNKCFEELKKIHNSKREIPLNWWIGTSKSSFSNKIYGKHSAENRRKKKEAKLAIMEAVCNN